MRVFAFTGRPKQGLWVAAIAGLVCGIGLGNVPVAHGVADPCYAKTECIQMNVGTCADNCSGFTSFCGSAVLAKATNFLLVENASPGVTNVGNLSGWEFCYRKQPCQTDTTILCPGDSSRHKCKNNGVYENISGYVEGGVLGDSCPD